MSDAKKKDPYGLKAAAAVAATETTPATAPLNLDEFAPTRRTPDVARAAAARTTSEERKFHRTTRAAAAEPIAATTRKGRVKLSSLKKDVDPRNEEPRAQLNIAAPQSVILRWHALMDHTGAKSQWHLLDRVIAKLEEEEE